MWLLQDFPNEPEEREIITGVPADVDITGWRKRSKVNIKNLVVAAELQGLDEEGEDEGLFMVGGGTLLPREAFRKLSNWG